jgi:hypothetical protein
MALNKQRETLDKILVRVSMDWHRKAGVLFVFPILVVGLTAILMIHGKSLGFKEIMVNVSWLPGYSSLANDKEEKKVKAYLEFQGQTWVGTKAGLFREEGRTWRPAEGMPRMDIKQMLQSESRVFVVAKGLWMSDGKTWQQVFSQDTHSLSEDSDGNLSLVTEKGEILKSLDQGIHWRHDTDLRDAVQNIHISKEGIGLIPLSKLMGDLHTGKALFGKSGEWIWVDSVSLIIGFLTLGGFYFWIWKKQRRFSGSKNV